MKLGKREICIYAAVSVVCILMVWLMGRFIFGFWGGESSESEAEVVSVVPDGEAEPIHESKSEAYRSDVGRRNESIDDYFGRLAPEGDEEISLVSGEGMPDRSRVGARDDGMPEQVRHDGGGRYDGRGRHCGLDPQSHSDAGNSSVRKNEGGKSSGTATERVFGAPPPDGSRVGARDDGSRRYDGSGRHCGLDPQSGVGSSPRRNGSGAATISSMSPEEKLEYDRRRAEMVRDVLTDSGIPGQARNDGMPDQVRHDEGGVDNGSVIAGNDPQSAKAAPLDFSVSSSDGIISSLDDEMPERSRVGARDDGGGRHDGMARDDGIPGQARYDGNNVIAGNDPQSPKRPFRCMFVRDEKIKSGQRVAVRLLEEYNDGSIRIPANTHLQAICKLDSRLHLSIRSLEMNGKIIPLQFEAYDTDGLEGIYCPESSKAVKTATNDLITTAGTSLGGLVGNIANTVIRTGATIARTASGENAVSINSGYEFFLVKTEKR